MEGNENKYPVLYYDLENIDSDTLMRVFEQLSDYFKKEKVPFIMLPKQTNLSWLTKEEAVEIIEKMLEEVKKWD